MTAAWLSLLLFAGWGSVLRCMWRKDIRARQAAEADNDRLRRRLTVALDRAHDAEEQARQAYAREDAALAELQRHLATCLGGRITYDSERRH